MGGEALSTGLRLPSTTPPASHWLSPERHESRAFPAKQPLQSELLTALGLRCLQGRGRGVGWGRRRKSYRGRRAPAAFSQPRARPVLPEQPSRRCCGCCELQLR